MVSLPLKRRPIPIVSERYEYRSIVFGSAVLNSAFGVVYIELSEDYFLCQRDEANPPSPSGLTRYLTESWVIGL